MEPQLNTASLRTAEWRIDSKVDNQSPSVKEVLVAAGNELLYIMRNNDYSKLKTTGNLGKIVNEIQCILEDKTF